MRASTIIIQRKWRAMLSGRIAHEHFLMIKVGKEREKKKAHLQRAILGKKTKGIGFFC